MPEAAPLSSAPASRGLFAESLAPRWRPLVWCLLVASSRCASDDASSASTPLDTAQQETIASIDSLVVPDGDAPAPLHPPCLANVDCVNVFAGLGACEVAMCRQVGPGDALGCLREQRPAGSVCNDPSDRCALEARCSATGRCERTAARTCDADQCYVSLGCNAATGECDKEPADEESTCDDGDPCTNEDVCLGGTCTAGAPVAQCACVRDADCAGGDDDCAGVPACELGRCVLLPLGGILCSQLKAGPCESVVCADGGCAIVSAVDGASCDDGNACTSDDQCSSGACEGEYTETCSCKSDIDCAVFDDLNSCNGSVRCDVGSGTCRVDPATRVVCADVDECRVSVCQKATGLCVETNEGDGVSCSDGNACTLADRCEAGVCKPGPAATCGPPSSCDGQPCSSACLRDLTCDSAVGCPLDESYLETGTPCLDGDSCVLEDTCVAGACTPGTVSVNCADANVCTLDACMDGTCVTTPSNEACDDGDPCSLDDQCVLGECAAGASLDCDDGEPCTTDFCSPGDGCASILNTASCDDGDPCSVGDRCQSGQCKPGSKLCPCSEDADCAPPGFGSCTGIWHCIESQCLLETSAAVPCATPADSCSANVCSFITGQCSIAMLPDSSSCADGDVCTSGDRCVGGACQSGSVTACDDGVGCTADACDPDVGCVFEPLSVPCDDGDPCTETDACVAGECSGVSVCACEADTDCPTPANLCNGIMRCALGACTHDETTKVTCATAGPCRIVGCDPKSGECGTVAISDDAPCNDLDACTDSDRCILGSCTGVPRSCDDGNPCTVDLCAPTVGCAHVPSPGPCNDGDPCTPDEACALGVCVASTTGCTEDCGNSIDDDLDGTVDCVDDDCSGAALCSPCHLAPPLVCGVSTPGALADDAPSQIGTSSCGNGPLADRLYRFTTTQTGPVAVTLLSGSDRFSLRVLASGAGGACDATACKAAGPEASFQAVAGVEYHVVVEKLFSGGAPGFVVGVTCANACVPSCAIGCGPDGCGGICGVCVDGDPCTSDICTAAGCLSTPSPGCCKVNEDCPGTAGCEVAFCDGGKCRTVEIAGCCAVDADCPTNGPCKLASCVLGECTFPTLQAGCCALDSDCEDDRGCTEDRCIAGNCKHAFIAECCSSAADCSAVGPCELATCVAGTCGSVGLPFCCAAASDCDDGKPCTVDLCGPTGECSHDSIPDCCESAGDCGTSSSLCITTRCLDGVCVAELEPEGCCLVDSHCSTGDPCLQGSCVEGACVSSPISGCCRDASDCSAEGPCEDVACIAGLCINRTRTECCVTSAGCDDGQPCTVDGCFSGQCRHDLITGCCSWDEDCDDGELCTEDQCSAGACKYTEVPECCKAAADCGAGPCLTASCQDGGCVYDGAPGCCSTAADCQTATPCLSSACIAGTCVLSQKPGCCTRRSDCPEPGIPCAKAACIQAQCKTVTVADCCADATTCSSAVGCSEPACVGSSCTSFEVDGCCTAIEMCPGPALGCGDGFCAGGSCATADGPDCCNVAEDCSDSTEACTESACVGNVCMALPNPGCCQNNLDCAGGGGCTPEVCVLGRCQPSKPLAGCCDRASDCPAPDSPCALRDCVSGQCINRPIEGCCSDDVECAGLAAGPCTQARCDDGSCTVVQEPECCDSKVDCAFESGCAVPVCQQGACAFEFAPGCCIDDDDCPSDGACGLGRCDEGTCSVYVVSPNCCEDDGDCLASSSCVVAACENNQCAERPKPGCCIEDMDCLEDADICLSAACMDGQCQWASLAGCCQSDDDCPGAETCTIGRCEDGQCVTTLQPSCSNGSCLFHSFEPGLPTSPNVTLAGGFVNATGSALAGDGEARVTLSAGPAGASTVSLAPFTTAGGATLRFFYRLDVPYGDCDGGSLRVETRFGDSGSWTERWRHCTDTASSSALIPLPTSAVPLSVRLVVVSKGAGAVSAALDDIAVTGCVLVCGTTCDDGNSCTVDVCNGGKCASAPKLGCCSADVDCADGDPCTHETCGAVGCVVTAAADCAVTACVEERFSSPALSTEASGDASVRVFGSGIYATLPFERVTTGSLSPGGHLAVSTTATDVGQSLSVSLPYVQNSPGTKITLRFALRQSLGSACELGRLHVEQGSQTLALPCGFHDWRAIAVPLTSKGTFRIRLDVYQAGAAIEIDELRLTGPCHLSECVSADDCDDGDACTLDGCDASYRCIHAEVDQCCEADADCATGALCESVRCSDGRCQRDVEPACGAGACAWLGGQEVAPTADPEVWTRVESGLQGPALGWSGHDDLLLGFVRILAGGVTLRVRIDAELPGDCVEAGVLLLVDSEVLSARCESAGGGSELEDGDVLMADLSRFAGRSVALRLRFHRRQSGTPASLRIREVRLDGQCITTECHEATDCDDGETCTDDLCLGNRCVHRTRSGTCSDGDACTGPDRCQDGLCASPVKPCDDGNPCTDDLCHPRLGCMFTPNVSPCSDGETCTVGDRCSGGACVGTPLVCFDGNECTRDGCEAGIGCLFAPEPQWLGCASGNGLCWDGFCTEWEVGTSSVGDSALMAIRPRTSAERLVAVGRLGGAPAVFALDQFSIEAMPIPVIGQGGDAALGDGLNAMTHDLAVGGRGIVDLSTGSVTSLPMAPGVVLRAATGVGQTVFVAGDGDGVARTRSTLFRCTLGTELGKCQRMPIVFGSTECGRQVPFQARALTALTSQSLFVGGFSLDDGNAVARVATWDGNVDTECMALDVHSGRASYAVGSPAPLRLDRLPPGRAEGVLALVSAFGGAAAGTVVAGGWGGLLASWDATTGWRVLEPQGFPAAALWSDRHDVHSMVISGSDLHVIGDGAAIVRAGCRHGFYLHARRESGQWIVDALHPLPETLADCGPAPHGGIALHGVAVDGLTRDLIVVGALRDGLVSRALALRLRRP